MEIESTQEPSLAAFLTALGIPEVGSTTARELAREFGTFEAIRTADTEDLQEVSDVGPRVASAIREFFETDANRQAVDRLLSHVDPQSVETDDNADQLADETFVFTGSLSEFTRSEAQELVERHGGSATSSVSGNTDYLVVGDNAGQRKQDDAEEHGVERLSEDKFLSLLDERGIESRG